MIERKFTQVEGIKTCYLETAPEQKEAAILLFIHGFLDRANVFEKLITALAHKYHIYALDLPGSGESGELKSRSVSFAQLAAFTRKFCEQAGIKKAIVCGHSMGGAIALNLAGMHPGFIDKLVLFDAVSYTVKQPLKLKIIQLPIIGAFIFKKFYGFSMYRDYYMHDVYYDNTLLNQEKLKQNYDLFNTPARREFSYKLLQLVLKPSEVTAAIKTVSAPALIIWGEKDKLIPLSCARQLAAAITGAKLAIIPGCGHPSFSEKPGEAIKIMLEFLS